MKINYKNEDYISSLCSSIVFTLIIIGICIFTFLHIDKSIIIFSAIMILLVLPFLIVSIISYIKCKRQRNLNLFIMKNGKCIRGEIKKIEEKSLISTDINRTNSYWIVVTVEFELDGEVKEIVVDDLLINKLDKYRHKEVNVYIYNNMNYVDIRNS